MVYLRGRYRMPVRNRISTLLGERRENISNFARGAGIAWSTAHRLYHDRMKMVDFEVLEKACRYLGRDIGEVIYLDPPLGGEEDGQEA
jgi:putative transcriptional regulator